MTWLQGLLLDVLWAKARVLHEGNWYTRRARDLLIWLYQRDPKRWPIPGSRIRTPVPLSAAAELAEALRYRRDVLAALPVDHEADRLAAQAMRRHHDKQPSRKIAKKPNS
jgi:hypothetical protein